MAVVAHLRHECRRLLTIFVGTLGALLAVVGPAWAEWNPTPIAIPLIGTSGVSSPYPSAITLTPPGGSLNIPDFFTVTLHAVTHPCPEDLAVLLVRDGDDARKFLLMSNAGGCHPLQGTDVVFGGFASPLPDEDPVTTPYGSRLTIRTSNYGAQPSFPAPAPAGPYLTSLPPALFGTWKLYVLDQRANNRGVIAGGWSLTYDHVFQVSGTYPVPVGIPDVGTAGVYPITFDASAATPDARVTHLEFVMGIEHTYSDDLRIVLESPDGTAVVVMANAGGPYDWTSATTIFFADGSPPIPDEGPVGTGMFVNYRPGSEYGGPTPSLPAPAPPAPYATAFSAFNGHLARGVWKLWIYDDESPDGGNYLGANLNITTDRGAPTSTIILPTETPTYTATQPILPLFAQIDNVEGTFSTTWRVTSNGSFYDAGSLEVLPHAGVSAFARSNIPVKKGTNVVQMRTTSTSGAIVEQTVTITVNEFAYTLSEGATGGFFDEDVTLGNAADVAAPVRVDFLQEGASPVTHYNNVAPNAPLQLHVDDLVPPGAVSTVVHSTDAVPLAVERTMSWDSTGYGGSGGTAISPDLQWLFAEGSQGYFDTYLLLANDNDASVSATVRFLLEGGGVFTYPVTLDAHKRRTIYAGDIPALINTSFGMEVTADAPITAERAMYFPHTGARVFEGGHEAAGVNSTSRHWFLAEGATGPFFECFILLSNPSTITAHATLTYLLPNGDTIPQSIDVPANGRATVNVETVDSRLLNTAVSTIVTADRGIIVERSMYWPDIPIGWREAHNSMGVTDPALRWGVSDIRVGGPRAYQTYVLLANPNVATAEVQVRLLRSGAAPIVQTYTLPPTSRTNIFAADLAGAPGTYSAEVQVLNYQPIVVEKALYWKSGAEIWAAGTGVVATALPPR
jgi:subtilisin-like proprotein convertase family protein